MANVPRRPQRPDFAAADGKPKGGSCLTVSAAAMMAVAGLLSLMAMPLMGFGPLLIVGGLAGFAAFHYVVWGWWLGRLLRDEATDDEDPPYTSPPRHDST